MRTVFSRNRLIKAVFLAALGAATVLGGSGCGEPGVESGSGGSGGASSTGTPTTTGSSGSGTTGSPSSSSGMMGPGSSGSGMMGPGSSGSGMMMGPTTCASDADCTGKCPAGSLGCKCVNGGMGDVCTPTCTKDSDCPAPPMGTVTCDTTSGVCKLQM